MHLFAHWINPGSKFWFCYVDIIKELKVFTERILDISFLSDHKPEITVNSKKKKTKTFFGINVM